MTQDNMYDQNGIRIEKTVNGVTENYHYANGKAIWTGQYHRHIER